MMCGHFKVSAKVASPCSACATWEAYNRAFPEYPKLFCSSCGRALPKERVS
jgi:hypothetical protein